MLTFVGNTWRDVCFLQFESFYWEDEAEPLYYTSQELIALLESERRTCFLLGGEKVLVSYKDSVIVRWECFDLYVLVLEQDSSLPSNIDDVPIIQRDGMLLFRYSLGTDR
jgi:hypothetical protein